MNQIDPKSLKIINSLPPIARKGDKISVDSEFSNQIKERLHRAHGDFSFLGCSYDGVSVYYITDEAQIQEFYDRIDAGVHLYVHAKYDLTQLRRFANLPQRKLLWDCMLIEQIMFSGYYSPGEFSLADLARRYLDIYLPKEVRAEFGENDNTASLTQEQLEYSCVDVVATWRVYQAQREMIDENDLEIWKKIELPFLWTILSMGGIRLDTEKWIALAEKNEKIAKDIQDKYGHIESVKLDKPKRSGETHKDEFVGINLNSPKQVKEHFASIGYKKLTSTDVEALESLADECEFAKDMLLYRTHSKRASTYGRKFIEDYVEADGKIYADLFQVGGETGRTSCRTPNLQNQPNEKEYRDCFIAEENNCLVVADYGSQEPRIAAYLSQDEGLINALNGTEKLYITIARDALGIRITKESPEYSHIKSTILGIFYGMSASGLSKRIGVDKDSAQDMIDSILQAYPGIRDYMNRQKQAQDYVTSIYGRKIWLNKYSYQWERNALNAPIQSSAADATKLACNCFLEKTSIMKKSSWNLCLIIHDELVIQCPISEYDETIKLLESCMIYTAENMHDGIRGVVEIYNGSSWSCKS